MLLDNSGSNRPATYLVSTPTGTTESHAVSAGAKKTLTYPAADGGAVEVRIGDTSLAKIVLDCPVRALVSTITPDCATVSILLDNAGSNRAVGFAVTTPSGAVETITVGARESRTVTYPAVDGATVTVGFGDAPLAVVVLDCPVVTPLATITPDCTTVSVLLDNTGSNRSADFAVTPPSGAVESVTVPAGQTRTVTYPAADGATVEVSRGDTVLATEVLDCPMVAPAATVTPSCTITSVLPDNAGSNRPVDYTVLTPLGVETVTLLAGQSVTVEYPAVAGGTTTVEAEGLAAPVSGVTGTCDEDTDVSGGPVDGGDTDGSGNPVDEEDSVVVIRNPAHHTDQGSTARARGLPGTGGQLPVGLLVLGWALVAVGALTLRVARR